MKLKLSDYLKASELPTVPLRFGNLSAWNTWQWQMLANDKAGCCVWSGFAHQVMAWCGMLGDARVTFTDDQILGPEAYGETGYVPGYDDTDKGTDMVQACQFWQDKGFFGHTIRGFAEVNPSNVATAAYIFGSCGVGISVTQAQMDQFDGNEPWDPVPGSAELGGHYVPVVGRNAHGNLLCITWGRLQAMTPAFLMAQCDEAVVQLSDDWLNSQEGVTPRGIKLADLLIDMKEIANS